MESGSAANSDAQSTSQASGKQSQSSGPKYEVIKEIGKGSFGRVFQIRRAADGKVLVWKEINYGSMSEREKQLIVSEVNILRELRHPNITRYYDRVIDKDRAKLFIVMEFCAGGDLAAMIRTRKKQLRDSGNTDVTAYVPEDTAWKIIAQLTLALLECHMRKEGNKILHRDLKPGNVFFDAEQNVKLGDFGLSRMMGDESVFAYTHVGTPYYMSPEQIQEQRYNEKSDIWSAGCVIYEMLSLRAPFEATNQIQLAYKIKLGKIERIPAHFSDELFQVVQSMISLEPARRPGVKNLMKHPRISFVIRQLEVRRKEADVSRKQSDVAALDQAYKERCEKYEQKAAQVEERKAQLKQLEERLQRREALLKQRKEQQYGTQQIPNSGRAAKYGLKSTFKKLTEFVKIPANLDTSLNEYIFVGGSQQAQAQPINARVDSTDRAISRILDKQLSGGPSDLEDAKKENDQKMVNLKFTMDRNQAAAGAARDENQTMPSSIHSQQQQTLAMKRQSNLASTNSQNGLSGVGDGTGDPFRPAHQNEMQDTQTSLGSFSSVVVQTPQHPVIPKEMPGSSAQQKPLNTQTQYQTQAQADMWAPGDSIQGQEESKQSKQSTGPGGGLLSGIEMQRQKLQELKRGLNQASTSSSKGPQQQLQSKTSSAGYFQQSAADAETAELERQQSAKRFATQQQQDSLNRRNSSKLNGGHPHLSSAAAGDQTSFSKRQSPMARHGRYASTNETGVAQRPGSAAHQSKPSNAFNARQRSNSAQKLTSNDGGYSNRNQQPPSNTYISRLRSQSRERIQQAQAMLDRQSSQTRIAGSNVSTPVVQQQKVPLPGQVHGSASGSQFQTPQQALAGMIRRNVSTGRGSGSRNRYDTQTASSQNPTTYLSSHRSQTAMPGQPPPSHYNRVSAANKYPGNTQQQHQFSGRRGSANQTQQTSGRSHTSGLTPQNRFSSPANKQLGNHNASTTTTHAAQRAGANYSLAHQRRQSNSRLSTERQQNNLTAQGTSSSSLAMAGRAGRVASRQNSRGDSIGNRNHGGSQSRLSGAESGAARHTAGQGAAQGSTGRSSQRDLRNALEEITQRIQSKYLQV